MGDEHETYDAPIIGWVTTRDITMVRDDGQVAVVEGRTYPVVEISERRGVRFYVTNRWYKKHRREPLVIVETLVEMYVVADPSGR